MLNLNHPLDDLQGAEYNPRKIDDDAIDRLCESLTALGVCKPIIARGQTIVAGHQRTRALRKMGVTHAPVFMLAKDTTTYDEVRFNQLHNGTDLDMWGEGIRVNIPPGTEGFIEVPANDIEGDLRSRGAKIRTELCRLIGAYGRWGASVALDTGEVIHAGQYALACKMLRVPALIYVMPADKREVAIKYLSAQYGVFNYDHIKRETFVQTMAQMFRLRGGEKDNKSPTYEGLVIPYLKENPTARVLDFGCGQGDYVKKLAAEGYDIIGMEFFRRKGDAIDVDQVNRMVNTLIGRLENHGRFDVVVMDYVLNSVDSQQAEEDVLNSIDLFCKPGGMLFFSGRSRERVDDLLRHKSSASKQKMRQVEFLDKNGLTALYRKGSWFFQKFHRPEDIDRMCELRGWKKLKHNKTVIGFNIMAEKGEDVLDSDAGVASLRSEFDMVVNKEGRTLGRADDIEKAIRKCLK